MKSKMEQSIRWMDDVFYTNLSPSDKRELGRFRSLYSYIRKMEKTNLRLISEIERRKESIIEYRKERLEIYKRLQHLNGTLDLKVRVNRSSSKRKRDSNETYKSVRCECYYNGKRVGVISLKSSFEKAIELIGSFSPKWLKRVSHSIGNDRLMKDELEMFFQPLMEKLILHKIKSGKMDSSIIKWKDVEAFIKKTQYLMRS